MLPNERLSGVPGGQVPRPLDAAAARRLEARVRLLPTRDATPWVGRVGSRLFAELDLPGGGEVLDVYSGRKAVAVPVEFRKRRVRADLKESRDFPSGKGCIARVLSGALQEGLAVADGVSDLDLLRPLSPTAHWRPHPLCAAELALLNQEVNELGVGGGSGVMMALPRTEPCFDCHQIVTLAGDRK